MVLMVELLVPGQVVGSNLLGLAGDHGATVPDIWGQLHGLQSTLPFVFYCFSKKLCEVSSLAPLYR